ncbi:hypothetical protein DXG03_009768, partial [Asterophora parasitica]
PYLLNIADISAVHKTAENLLKIVLDEIKYVTEVLQVIIVAWCTDASSKSLKMQWLLWVQMPWIITLDCWCHQINLIVGNIFKVKGIFVKCIEDAIKVIKWFNNHSRALRMLNDIQQQKFLKVLCLILPILMHWTSHYLAICKKADAKKKAQEVIGILEGYNFWGNLKWVKNHLEPLAIAANITQSDNAHLDTVVLTLINLYQIYSDATCNFDETIAQAVLVSLKKCWAKADQPIFIVVLILNPYICSGCFARNSPYLFFASLWNQFSIKHSKLHNHIHPEKVQKEVLIKTNTLAKLGPPPQCKHAFGDNDGKEMIKVLVPTNNPAKSAHDSLNFTAIMNKMVTDASQEPTDALLGLVPAGQPRSAPCTSLTTSNPYYLTLKLLFHYPSASDSISASFWALIECWRAGKQGFENELEYHNFMNHDDSEAST